MSFNPDKINIHELTIEEPEKQSELPFDPEKDITPEDWTRMNKRLDEDRQGAFQSLFPSVAMRMKILNPDADLKIDRFLIDNMKKNLESYRQPNASLDNWRNWSSLAAALKILGLVPDLNIDDECWQGMKSALEDAEKTNSGNGPGLARNMKILRPDQSILSPEIWRRIDGALEAYKKDLDKNSFGGTGYESFLHLAANIKILDPSHDLGIDDGVWEKLKGRLEWVRGEGSYVDILDDLMNMKILAAEDVRIPSEGGLVVNMRKPKSEFASDVPPLPETKQF